MRFDIKLYLTELEFIERQDKSNVFERSDGYVVKFVKDEEGKLKIVINNYSFKYNHICSCLVPETRNEAEMLFYLLDL